MQLNTLFKHWTFRIFAPGTVLREKYEAFKRLLRYDARCHEQMAEFQGLLHGDRREDLCRMRKRFALFSDQVFGMVTCLETMAPGEYVTLKDYHKKFDFYVHFLLAPPAVDFGPPFVLSLGEIHPENKNTGNKAKNLAILKTELNLPVPNGFAVTTNAFHYLVEYNNLRHILDDLLSELNIESSHSMNWISGQLMGRIRTAEVPPDIEQAILTSYEDLEREGRAVVTAVRSSAISEDGDYSFAGQYTSLLGVTKEKIVSAYLEVLASKYSPEALFYRISHGLSDEETAMSVLVLEMVKAECSGVLYTHAPMQDKEKDDNLHLHVVQGLGEALVGGTATPSQYVLSREEQPRLLSRKEKDAVLSRALIEKIGHLGSAIEEYFNAPQDIEWAITHDGDLFFLQARPLHISSAGEPSEETTAVDRNDLNSLLSVCERAAGGRAAGEVYRLNSSHGLEDIPAGAVLVTRDTPPSFVQVLNRLAAVVAERGSQASHFATVAREFGVPFLAGTDNAMDVLEPGGMVTVDGDYGAVYRGRIEALLGGNTEEPARESQYHRTLREVLKFISPLELMDPAEENFTPEGCRSMHDIIRFCHEKAVQAMFSAGRPGTGRGALRLSADLPLDVFLFDVGGGIAEGEEKGGSVPLDKIKSVPFQALWRGLGHQDVQWKQKPFDWDAYDKIELAGGIPPSRDSFAFASYAVIGIDYLHFNIRFGYHFTIVDVLCGENTTENYCLLRFAGGGGDFDKRSLRIDFITRILEQLEFTVEQKGDMLEARITGLECSTLTNTLDMLGRLLGATKLMDMVLQDEQMVTRCVDDFFKGRYSFSQEG